MQKAISKASAPPIGTVRGMQTGDVIWVHANARQRHDWARYSVAIGAAVGRGAEVRRFA